MVVNVSNTIYMDIFIWMIGTRDPMRLMAIVIVNIRQMREKANLVSFTEGRHGCAHDDVIQHSFDVN